MTDKDLDDKISVLYQLGHSEYEIARQLEKPRHFVHRSLGRTLTPRRTISEAKKLGRILAPVSLRLAPEKR